MLLDTYSRPDIINVQEPADYWSVPFRYNAMKDLMTKILEPKKTAVTSKRFSDAALKKMIVPLCVEQFLVYLVALSDTLMVSYAGEAVVSGVSLVSLIVLLFSNLFTALANGGCIMVSQFLGKGDKEKADDSGSQLVLTGLVFSVFVMLVLLIFQEPILSFLFGGAEADVMEACRVYQRIISISVPANALYAVGCAIYRSMGKTRTTMVVSILMNLINIVGNAIGIFVLHAGAAGVAWPSAISWYVAAAVMIALCFKKDNETSIRMKMIFRANGDLIRRILHVAVPNMISTALFCVTKIIMGSVIADFGTYQIAANGIGQTIWNFAALMCFVMGTVSTTVIGQCMGASEVPEAEYYIRKLTRLTYLLNTLWNLLILALMPLLLLFYDISPETRHLLYVVVIMHNLFSIVVEPVDMVVSSALRAAGDVRFAMVASVICTCVWRLAVTYIFAVGFNWGLVGTTLAMCTDWALHALVFGIRFRSGKWRRFKLV